MTTPVVIAIDGTAASGKGVIARALARHYGFAHLDTGLLYRALANRLINIGTCGESVSVEQAIAAARRMRTGMKLELLEQDPTLREEHIGTLASRIAAFAKVRAELRELQRQFATRPPNQAPGAVMEGRDIASVICPWAQVKLFIDASLEARSRRRFLELKQNIRPISEDEVRHSLEQRDLRDREREVAPLRQDKDALLLDTSNLDIKESIVQGILLVETRLREAAKQSQKTAR